VVPKPNPLDFDLYPVTCQTLSKGRSNLDVLDALIAGGVKVVQLRDKDLSDSEFFDLAMKFRSRTEQAGMTFIVNDRVDICRAVKADGVHLGQDDFPVLEARRLLGPDTVVGVSTHNIKEALRAVEEGASYINVGPIFDTKTKQNVYPAVGIDLFKEIKQAVNIPVTVMGGISLGNIDIVLEAGAKRIAVVTAITEVDNIEDTVREFRRRILDF